MLYQVTPQNNTLFRSITVGQLAKTDNRMQKKNIQNKRQKPNASLHWFNKNIHETIFQGMHFFLPKNNLFPANKGLRPQHAQEQREPKRNIPIGFLREPPGFLEHPGVPILDLKPYPGILIFVPTKCRHLHLVQFRPG